MLNIKFPQPLAQGIAIATLGIGCPLMLYASTFPTRAWCDLKQTGTEVTAVPIGQKSDFYWFLVGLGVTQGLAAWQLYRAVFESKSATATAGELPASNLQEVGAMPVWTASAPVQTGIAHTVPVTPTQPIQRLNDLTPVVKEPDTAWFIRVKGYKLVLLFGGQGAGKSSLAEAIVRERVRVGHHVEIWDVHRDAQKWVGLPVYGGGMNYKAVDERMRWAHRLIESRYQEIDSKGAANCNFQPVTIVVEELTNMATRCEATDEFYSTSLSDIRKACVFVLYVSHDRTLLATGGSKGLARARDASMLEVELFAESNPTTGEERPSGKGRMKLPGADKEKIDIETAPWMRVPLGFDYRTVMPNRPASETSSDTSTDTSADASTKVIPFPDSVAEQQPWKSSEVNPDEDYSDSSPSTSDFPTTEKALFLAISAHLGSGKSRTWVVENVLGFKGRRFAEGKELLESLLAKYGSDSDTAIGEE